MRVYLAGPMTGYPRWNFDAFALAAALLRDRGYEVVSPAEVELARGFDPDTPAAVYTADDYTAAMRRDVEALLTVDAVALMDGWASSRGASMESTVGRALGLRVGPLMSFLGADGPAPRGTAERVPPLTGQTYRIVPGIDEGYVPADAYTTTAGIDEATVITSEIADGSGRHKVVIDLDLPAHLIPSSTPGHFHLYVDHVLEWHEYEDLLNALAVAGLVEPGYVGASVARGFTAARLPWVKKGGAE